MTNSDRLQEIRERVEKATPELELKEIYPVAEIREMLDDNQVSGAWWVKSPTWIDLGDEGLFFTEPEAMFYANARPDIYYLLQLVTEQQRMIARLRATNKCLADELDGIKAAYQI